LRRILVPDSEQTLKALIHLNHYSKEIEYDRETICRTI